MISHLTYFVMKLLTVDCGIFSRGDNLMTGLIALLASYHDTMLEFTRILGATYSFTNVLEVICMPSYGSDRIA